MTAADLPAVNASLNALCAVFLIAGKRYIRKGNRTAHKRCMLTAFTVSVLFLASYVTYHALSGVKYFHGPAWARAIYLVILGSHTILAVVIVPLAIITLMRGLGGKFARHRRVARWTHPLWLYVSVTGVVVYVMLFQIFA